MAAIIDNTNLILNRLDLSRGAMISQTTVWGSLSNEMQPTYVSKFHTVPRPFYKFDVKMILDKYRAESLDAFFKLKNVSKYFWFNGGDFGNRAAFHTVNKGEVGSTFVPLPHRHVNPSSITVKTAGTETTSYTIDGQAGILDVLSWPSGSNYLSVKYANIYNVRFSEELKIEESMEYKEAYVTEFGLVENYLTSDPTSYWDAP
jgi:hypothetical protein